MPVYSEGCTWLLLTEGSRSSSCGIWLFLLEMCETIKHAALAPLWIANTP